MEQDEARAYAATHSDVILLDIRPMQEHREICIPGSRHLNFFELSSQRAWQVLGRPDGRPILVYCRSGLHSGTAAQRLRQYGYNAIDMGSISDWCGPLEGWWA